MKILFFPHFNSEYSVPLCEALRSKCKLKVFVWERFADEWYKSGVDVDICPGSGRFPDFSHALGIISKIREEKPDIVHFQGAYTWTAIVLHKIKVHIVSTIHDVIQHPGRNSKLFRFATKKHMINSSKVIVHGEVLIDLAVFEYGIQREKMISIPHGVLSHFKDSNSEYFPQENMFLFFGRIYDYKGLDVFLKAALVVSELEPSTKFVIAGSGDLSHYSSLMKGVQILKVINRFVTNSEVSELMQKTKAVVLPYKEASQTGVIPAAYSFGRTVIASSVGAIKEIVKDGETGLLFSPGDYITLAKHMLTLTHDYSLMAHLERGALEMASNELSWDSIAEKTWKVYNEVLS